MKIKLLTRARMVLVLVTALIIVLTGCSKKNDPKPVEKKQIDVLVAGTWNYEKVEGKNSSAWVTITPMSKVNTITFVKTGATTGTFTASVTVNGSTATETGEFELSSDGKTLKLFDFTSPSTILILDEHALKFESKEVYDADLNEYASSRFTFKR